jgi:hypothetical protein
VYIVRAGGTDIYEREKLQVMLLLLLFLGFNFSFLTRVV